MTDIEQAQRDHVIKVAREWIGTPYHHNANIKQVGVDCAHLLAQVFMEAGLLAPIDIEHYSPEFMLHRDNELYLAHVMRHSRKIEENEARGGDLVLYKIGRVFAHGGIIVDWPQSIIHAHMHSRQVIESLPYEADLKGRQTIFYSPWPNVALPHEQEEDD